LSSHPVKAPWIGRGVCIGNRKATASKSQRLPTGPKSEVRWSLHIRVTYILVRSVEANIKGLLSITFSALTFPKRAKFNPKEEVMTEKCSHILIWQTGVRAELFPNCSGWARDFHSLCVNSARLLSSVTFLQVDNLIRIMAASPRRCSRCRFGVPPSGGGPLAKQDDFEKFQPTLTCDSSTG